MCLECGYIFSMPMEQSVSGPPPLDIQQDPLIGKVLDNKYVITEMIGTGGMGAVYKGEQQFLEKTVAIKILESQKLDDERAVAMFYREARLAARLNHPNSITIYDFGKTQEGVLYMVMEYLRGESLSSILLSQTYLSPERTANVVRQACLALEAAHELGLVHRDLKPENIFLERLSEGHDHVTVLDLGIAKQLKMGDPSLTNPGMVWGTPLYMSPEQATGKPIDQRTDIYSLGVVMYEMLCGEPPFISDNPTEILISHVHDEPVPPSEVAPDLDIPPALEHIALWAMAKAPDDRISSVS
ncbi:serine/threonine protein kinase, partial [Myxococcota bacterium]|nr:serine/threonine protein kinase [Myxococcota bacterium]